ncbi:hypothetical protein MLD38_008649 [Melastoma candidum]|nr:hypothetical protein MLD38_008649 [Melastoma candidum]
MQIVSGSIDDDTSEQGAVRSCQLEENVLSIRSVGKDGNSICMDHCSPMFKDILVEEDADPIDTVDSNAGKCADILRNIPDLSELATSVCQVLKEMSLIEAAEAACDKSSSTSAEKEIEEEEGAAPTCESCSESSSCGKDNPSFLGTITPEAREEANSLCPVDPGRGLVSEKDEPMTLMLEYTVVNSEAKLDNHRPDNENSGFDRGCSRALTESCLAGQQTNEGQTSSSGNCLSRTAISKGKKRRSEVEYLSDTEMNMGDFIRSPCEGLRPRIRRDMVCNVDIDIPELSIEKPAKRAKVPRNNSSVSETEEKGNTKFSHKCSIEGCRMRFKTKGELSIHIRNRCPVEGCGKKIRSHKYAALHQRVHKDDRPLKCPWKGCSMTFKWAWARTEHIRVHTGERPYVCKVEGCGRSFRFVSDYSRHRRKTGHYVS